MPLIDKRLLDMLDPVAAENFNRTLKVISGVITSAELVADSAGKITGGTIALADNSTIPITVVTATE